jgi:hypothetical protein
MCVCLHAAGHLVKLLVAARSDGRSQPMMMYACATVFQQTLLDDPDVPGYQPALPPNFSLEDFAQRVEAEQQEKARRKRGLF